MGFHHVAVATRDMAATDRFYRLAMGFDLVRVEVGKTPEGGWAKHFFYDTGNGDLMAFWELHDESLPAEFPTGLALAAGLPQWTNHLAFRAANPAELETHLVRWLECGYDVVDVDHHWCRSIYTNDPNGTMVEFCVTTAAFGAGDRERARDAIERNDLEHDLEPSVRMHRSEKRRISSR